MKKQQRTPSTEPRKRPTARQRLQTKLVEYPVKQATILFDFLMTIYPSKGRNSIKSLLARSCVLVDGTPIRQFDFPLFPKDIVQIAPRSVKPSRNQSKLVILHEDEEFLVIDKPAGLLSVATDKEKTVTAYRLAMDHVRQQDAHARVFVTHRIDKETSGVLLFTKNEALKNDLQNQWNQLVKKREYYAVAEGHFDEKKGTKTSWLLETKTNIMFSSSRKGDGQKAVTHYEVKEETDQLSLVKVSIDSGRKNQIRVHLKEMGHTIVGDDKYGSEVDPLKRLGLHASTLALEHPYTHAVMEWKAKLPAVFHIKKNLEAEKKLEKEEIKRIPHFMKGRKHSKR